jgi:hypothetical protein
MAQDEAILAASWDAPPWAQSSEVDEQAVIHSRPVGSLADLDGQQLRVDVVQRDDLCLMPGGATVVREPVWLRVAEARLSLDQALRLAKLLLGARRVADSRESGLLGARRGIDRRQSELLEHGWRRASAASWPVPVVEGLAG